MKMQIKALGLALSMLACSQAVAGADDTKWINKCIADNKAEGQTAETVKTYCTCMNNKMDDNETQSISQWEKTHKKENEECSRKAGWKG
jgi:hypothetical protein